ncbi:MAG: Hsp20/alpha crystallin family protein, partial [Verrucomicrobiota bacterium]
MSEDTTTTTPTTCYSTADKETEATQRVHYQRPKYRVESNEEAHVVSVAMPGVGKDGVSVKLDGDELTVTGTRGHRVDDTWKTVFSELDED